MYLISCSFFLQCYSFIYPGWNHRFYYFKHYGHSYGTHRKYECICARTIKEAEGGLEIVGELNDFVRESIKEFYHNIDENHDVRILLVNSQDRILPEVSEDLGAHWS